MGFSAGILFPYLNRSSFRLIRNLRDFQIEEPRVVINDKSAPTDCIHYWLHGGDGIVHVKEALAIETDDNPPLVSDRLDERPMIQKRKVGDGVIPPLVIPSPDSPMLP